MPFLHYFLRRSGSQKMRLFCNLCKYLQVTEESHIFINLQQNKTELHIFTEFDHDGWSNADFFFV